MGFLVGLGLAVVPSGGCGGVHPVADMPVGLAGPIRSCAVMHEHHLAASDHTVKFDVALVNGQVESLVLIESTLGDEELERCLASEIRSFTMDDLPLRGSANLEHEVAQPESRELLGNPAVPLAACLASPPCLLGLVVVMGAAVITVQLTVYSATMTATATATPATTATPTPTATATPKPTATPTTTSPPIPIGASQRCLPCLPVPVGGIAYEYHSAAAGNEPHDGMANHTHHFKMNQSPPAAGCRCFWKRNFVSPTPEFSPLPGAVLVSPAAGGGIGP
ncbi:MAG TPA: hypothetical protein PK156_15510 [Polyangium sp.]|nr:hypothetical protein [Polyangium sp.]